MKGIEKHMHAYSETVIVSMKDCNTRSTTVEDGWRGDREIVVLLEDNSKNNEGNDSSPPS